MELDTDLQDGTPVTVEYEFEEGDPSVGLDDDFEITVFCDGKDITNDLTDKDRQAILAKVAQAFEQYVQDCRAEAAYDRAEQQAFDREWDGRHGY